MNYKDIEILIEIVELYRVICDEIGVECKLNKTTIEDTLARLERGEYEIRRNPEW